MEDGPPELRRANPLGELLGLEQDGLLGNAELARGLHLPLDSLVLRGRGRDAQHPALA